MADPRHTDFFRQHVLTRNENIIIWNKWRKDNPEIIPDLTGIELEGIDISFDMLLKLNVVSSMGLPNLRNMNFGEANLKEANLSSLPIERSDFNHAKLNRADLSDTIAKEANFVEADLSNANLMNAVMTQARFNNSSLCEVDFRDTDLSNADFGGADLRNANLSGAKLSNTSFSHANLSRANLNPYTQEVFEFYERPMRYNTDLTGTIFSDATLCSTELSDTDLSEAVFKNADLSRANLNNANLTGIDLSGAKLCSASLINTIFKGANLSNTDLSGADLSDANLSGANLREAKLNNANLYNTHLSSADLSHAQLIGADLTGADLRGAKLINADLSHAIFIGSNISNAKLNGAILTSSWVYAISAWDIETEDTNQLGLIITPYDEKPEITVDSLEVAQFIYLLLNDQKIRDVIDTITSKVVLILGRFIPERKQVLDAIRDELRQHNYSPVIFNFEEHSSESFIETARTLANMAHFVLIDLTDVDDIVRETATSLIPRCIVPFQPFQLSNHRYDHALVRDLQQKYHWVLPPHWHKDIADLLASFQEHIIQPAENKITELKQRKPLKVCFSSAPEDREMLDRLKKHLYVLERSGQIEMWDDRDIELGSNREEEVEKQLSEARIILLLISPDFMASNDCYTIQEKAMRGNAKVIPILLRSCAWKSTSLGQLQVLPRGERPIEKQKLDDIFFGVSEEISSIIKEIR